MRIVAISDTHGLQNQIDLPDADMLIHCGDITMKGEEKLYDHFLTWMQAQSKRYKHVLCIAGNHDFHHEYFVSRAADHGITYLENSGLTIEGIRFYGCPNVSKLPRWAFDDHTDPDLLGANS